MKVILEPTITRCFYERAQQTPKQIGFVNRGVPVSFSDYYEMVRRVSYGLFALGLLPKEKVAIYSSTRFEWSLADMAILCSGGITVPIYPSSTPEDVFTILEHSDTRFIFVESVQLLQKILAHRPSHVEKMILIDSAGMQMAHNHKDVLSIDALREVGKREEKRSPNRFQEILLGIKPEDVLTYCYTSGTTGQPKGVILTHVNLLSVIADCAEVFGDQIQPEKETVLSFLPFSHIFGKAESLATYCFGWKQTYARSLETLMEDFQILKPTLFFSVPRIFEKAYAKIFEKVETASASKKKLFHWALGVGERVFSARRKKEKPAFVDLIQYEIAKRLVFKKILNGFGEDIRFSICGGAPLPQEIGEFFEMVGLMIHEGYGLTETSSAITLNRPGQVRFGTVGKPLPEVSFKIADDGEILVQSNKNFSGYYKETSDTVFKEGWFVTGDIGHFDSDGYLHITDRKKDLIVTSAGKNIAPQKLENRAKSFPFLSHLVVYGDRRNYLVAIITLNTDRLLSFAASHHILFSEVEELVKNAKVMDEVQKIVNTLNQSLASYETIKKFFVLPHEFTTESGELTPSLKIKRRVISERYQKQIEALYSK